MNLQTIIKNLPNDKTVIYFNFIDQDYHCCYPKFGIIDITLKIEDKKYYINTVLVSRKKALFIINSYIKPKKNPYSYNGNRRRNWVLKYCSYK